MKSRLLIRLLAAALALGSAAVAAPAPAQAAPAPAPGLHAVLTDGFYRIRNVNSGLCLWPNGSGAGAGIGQVYCDSWGPDVRWFVDLAPDGSASLTSYWFYCLDLIANGPGDVRVGTLLQQMWCNPSWTSQSWFIEQVRTDQYVLYPRVNFFLCAQTEDKRLTLFARYRLAACNRNEPAQRFLFERI